MSPSDAVWYSPASRSGAAQNRLWMIREHLHTGEWWLAAKELSEARAEGDHVLVCGSWCGYIAQIPMSRMHSSRLLRLHTAGLATPGAKIKPMLEVLHARIAA